MTIKNFVSVIAVIMLALCAGVAMAIDPSTMDSMRPFKAVADHEGVGYAHVYKNRSKQEIAAIFRDSAVAAREMNVPCDVLLAQMVEAHPELPREGCAGFAVGVQNDPNFDIVSCEDRMFTSENFLALKARDGSGFGVWNRGCLNGEQVLTYKGKVIVSTMCLNTAVPKSIPRPASVKVAQTYGAWGTGQPFPQFQKPTNCPMIITPMVFTKDAQGIEGVAAQLGDENGGRRIEGAKDGSVDGDGSEDTRVSRGLGKAIHQQGALSDSSDMLKVEQIRGPFPLPGQPCQNCRVIFEGEVKGERRVSLPEDFNRETDNLLVTAAVPADYVSPSMYSGLRIWGRELQQGGTKRHIFIKKS